MSPEYSTYRTFLSIRNHFTKLDYDFHFYNGKVSTKAETFKKNKNYLQFVSLSRKVEPDDMVDFIAANFAHTKKQTVWITDLLEPEARDVFNRHRAYMESLSYRFVDDLKKVAPLSQTTILRSDSYPVIISSVMSGKIELETLCLMDKFYDGGLLNLYDLNIKERYLWPTFSLRCRKFTPFLKCEVEKLRIVLDKSFW